MADDNAPQAENASANNLGQDASESLAEVVAGEQEKTAEEPAKAAEPAEPQEPLTVEERLALLEADDKATKEELAGLRTLLERAGYDSETGTF